MFAFICSAAPQAGDEESDSGEQFPGAGADEGGPLTCHVFLCAKRKVAQNISLTVAKSFERAFDIWKSISHRRMISEAKQTPRCDYSPTPRPDSLGSGEDGDEEQVRSLLIDFNADLTEVRKSYLQNTWVSFEESEHLMSNLQKNAICSS